MNRQTTNSKNNKKRKGSCYYTLGRIISAPHAQFAGENVYQTVFVELFGGMRASALAGKNLVLTRGMYVCVKITPKSDGQTTYNIYELNDHAEEMIAGAHAQFQMTPTRIAKPEYDDDEELPF